MKTTYYKLTDSSNQTKNFTRWGNNVTHSAKTLNPNLCSDGWIHFYKDPILAVLINPKHANFKNPNMWEAEVSEGVEELHEPLKSGARSLTAIKQVVIPTVTLTHKIAFGILCAKQVCRKTSFLLWADNWLSGADRSANAAYAAYAYAAYTAYAAAYAAYAYATNAAYADAAAANAAYAAYAYADADAAYADADAVSIDFVSLAHEALKY